MFSFLSTVFKATINFFFSLVVLFVAFSSLINYAYFFSTYSNNQPHVGTSSDILPVLSSSFYGGNLSGTLTKIL